MQSYVPPGSLCLLFFFPKSGRSNKKRAYCCNTLFQYILASSSENLSDKCFLITFSISLDIIMCLLKSISIYPLNFCPSVSFKHFCNRHSPLYQLNLLPFDTFKVNHRTINMHIYISIKFLQNYFQFIFRMKWRRKPPLLRKNIFY